MNDLIRIIKQSISNGTYQLENVTREDKIHLEKLKNKGYIKYSVLRDAPDMVDLRKGENYDQL